MAETAEEKAARLAGRLGGEPDPQPGEPGGPPAAGGQEPPQNGGQEPPQQGDQTPPSTPPWGDDFTPERAWNTMQALRSEVRDLKAEKTAREREAMSESDRVKAELADAQAEVTRLRLEGLKTQVAAAKSLPADAIEFLHGSTQEELEASADKLMRLAGSGTGNPTRTPDFGAGARPNGHTPTDSEDFSARLRRQAGRPA